MEHISNRERGKNMPKIPPTWIFFPIWEDARKNMTNEWVTLIPWFPLLQKVKSCYSHCYRQQLNKTSSFFSYSSQSSRTAERGPSNGTWMAPHSFQSLKCAFTLCLAQNIGGWKWFAVSTLAEHGTIIVQIHFFYKTFLYHFTIWHSHGLSQQRQMRRKRKKDQTKAQTTSAQEPAAASHCWASASHKTHKDLHCCRSWCIQLTVK